MKLKQAKKFAKEIGYNWVAVDADNELFAYKHKPKNYGYFWGVAPYNQANFLGKYTGKKKWNKTLRKCK